MKKLLLRFSGRHLVLLVFLFSFTSVNAQTVDDTGTFDPITGNAVVYALVSFADDDSDGTYDASFVLSEGTIGGWSDYSVSVAFYNTGIQVRHEGSFVNTNTVDVVPGKKYHIWLSLDVTAKIYTTYVRAEDASSPVLIYENAGFRNTNISQVQRWSALHNPDGEPDVVNVDTVSVISSVGLIPGGNNAMSLPGGNNGSASNVAIPALDIADLPLTIEMWYKPDAIQNNYATLLYNRTVSGNSGIQYDRWTDQTKIKGVWNGASPGSLPAEAPIPDEWNHVAFVMTSSSQTLYINGVAHTESGSFANYPFDTITFIGWDKAVPDRTLKGLVDEVRIWNVERTAQELANNKYVALEGDETGLIGYWNFDDLSNTATDLSSGGHDGIIDGGAYIASFSRTDSDSDGVPDELDNCPETANTDQADSDNDGVGDVCDNCVDTSNADQTDIDEDGIGDACDPELPDDLNFAVYLPGGDGNASNVDISGFGLTTLPYTIEMWIKSDAVQLANAGLFFNRPGNIGFQYTSSWQSTSQSLRYMAAGGDTYGQGTETPDVSIGDWHHVAVVMTANSRTVYFDGESKTEANTFTANDFSSGSTFLGWDSDVSGRAFKGWIDEVRVWNVARTAGELESSKLDTLDVSGVTGLVGYWNFDDAASGVATDLSGNGYNGAITGGYYSLSSVFDPMEYTSSVAAQASRLINDNSSNNVVMVLEIETENQADALHLTELRLSASGTTDVSQITNVKVFATGADSVFSTETLAVELSGSPEAEDFIISMDDVLRSGLNHYWITYDIADGVYSGSTFALGCNEFVLSVDGQDQVHSPEVTDLAGLLTVDPTAFMEYELMDTDTVTTTSFSSVEGANFASFQQNAIQTFNGYQYVTYWTNDSKVAIARKALPSGDWEEMTLDYARSSSPPLSDNHQTISMGICESDGTIHIAYDHHDVPLRYQRSVAGLASDPESHEWVSSSFGPQQDYLVEGTQVTPVTYPRFISKPDGDMLFECRLGQSGNGDSFLWEYSGTTGEWTYVGEYINGTSVSQNAYINGLHYDPNGRLHVSWVWRETPDPQTNHDVYYGYSDDDGRTWNNAEGTQIATAETDPMTLDSEGLKVWEVGKNRGLINQEAQTVDSNGGVHILQSYIGEDHPNSNNFWGFRINYGDLRHIYQDESGTWHSDVIAHSARNRSEIAVDRNDNLYVVSGDHRVYFASAANGWQTWTEFDLSNAGNSQNEGFVDRERLLEENILSYLYASADNDGKILISNYRLASDNATLSDITVNGTSLESFDPEVYEYDVELPAGTDEVPVVVGESDHNPESIEVSHAQELPGTTIVKVIAENGLSTKTYMINFTVAILLGEEMVSSESVSIYPNPFTSSFRVESLKEISSLEIFSVDGKLIKRMENINQNTRHVSSGGLPAGLLIMRVILSDKTSSELRIINQK